MKISAGRRAIYLDSAVFAYLEQASGRRHTRIFARRRHWTPASFVPPPNSSK